MLAFFVRLHKQFLQLEEKLKIKAQLRDNVKAEMRKLQDMDQENVEETSVISSSPDQSAGKKANKRVEFQVIDFYPLF